MKGHADEASLLLRPLFQTFPTYFHVNKYLIDQVFIKTTFSETFPS